MEDNDTYTEVTHTSWGKRLGNAFAGVIAGIIIYCIGTGLLWWNEGRSVRTADAITEAQEQCVELPSIASVDPAFDGKLVHASGRAETEETLTDTDFGINATAIKLIRTVEYYQWTEEKEEKTEKKLGGGEETVTVYHYKKEWCSNPVDSSAFRRPDGHENWQHIQAADAVLTASNVHMGAYTLPAFLTEEIDNRVPKELRLSDEHIAELEAAYFSSYSDTSMIHSRSNTIYAGADPNRPEVGDVRVNFYEVLPQDVSIIAKAHGQTFVKFVASNREFFHRLEAGQVDMPTMFANAHLDNEIMKWVLRILGIILCVTGLGLVLRPLSVLADVLPILGDIVGMGTWLAATLIGLSWSLCIIALAWIAYRPVLAISLLVVAALLIGWAIFRGRKKKLAAQAA